LVNGERACEPPGARLRWRSNIRFVAPDFDFGDVPTWLATVGAVLAAYFAARAYVIETRRDAVAANLLRQEQASQIAVWTEYLPHPYTGEPEAMDCFVLRNASQLPIYEVHVFSFSHKTFPQIEEPEPVGQFVMGTVPPTEKPILHKAYVDGNKLRWAFAIQFRDAAGVVWHRDTGGMLWETELPDAERFKRNYVVDEL
jgi:hypothetical protein